MSSSYLDHLPSREREKIRKRMRSPEAYEKLREKVKGPEDLEREMEKREGIAELKFSLESQPEMHEKAKKEVESEIRERGIEQVVEAVPSSHEAKMDIEQGIFRLTVSVNPATHEDQLMLASEGNVQEKLPLKPGICDKISLQLKMGGGGAG